MEVEIWFLTKEEKKTSLHQIMRSLQESVSMQVAQNSHNDMYNCQALGDGYCFHPQMGILEMPKAKPSAEPSILDTEVKPVQIKNLLETSLIDCKDDYFFDLYCGKAKKEENKVPSYDLEIWVDTSTSMRELDDRQADGHCFRRSFISRLQKFCSSDKLRVSVFDTSLKTMGSSDTLCENYGTNDQDRLMRWIKNRDAKKLIIITDMNEYTVGLTDFIYKIGGTFKGHEHKKEIFSKNLPELAQRIGKICQ